MAHPIQNWLHVPQSEGILIHDIALTCGSIEVVVTLLCITILKIVNNNIRHSKKLSNDPNDINKTI